MIKSVRCVLLRVFLTVLFLESASMSGAVLSPSRVDTGLPSGSGQTAFNYSPTIVQTADGLLVAWVGASQVDGPDACIYLARKQGNTWSVPQKVASTIHAKTGIQKACSSPVLFKPANSSLMLFYRTENAKGQVRGMLALSGDNGSTWFPAKALPMWNYGPARVKPIELDGGKLLVGSDTHSAGWRVHVERGSPFRQSWGWSRTRILSSAIIHNAREPVLLDHGGGHIQMLCPTRRGYLAESWSSDSGESWDPFERTALPNPDGGIDVVKLEPRKFVMVYQHSNRERGVLNLATTEDGKQWSAVGVVENRPGRNYAEPALVRGADGNLHLVYCEDQSQIHYVALDPSRWSPVPMVTGNWPY